MVAVTLTLAWRDCPICGQTWYGYDAGQPCYSCRAADRPEPPKWEKRAR